MKGKINQSIVKSLHPFIKKTKHHLFDEDYDFWKDKDISDFTAIFMAGVIQKTQLMKKIKKISLMQIFASVLYVATLVAIGLYLWQSWNMQ